MTTYPLSEPATIYRKANQAVDAARDIVARGSLSDCAEFLDSWSETDRVFIDIEIDDMALRYGPKEIEDLLAFLREEASDTSNPSQVALVAR